MASRGRAWIASVATFVQPAIREAEKPASPTHQARILQQWQTAPDTFPRIVSLPTSRTNCMPEPNQAASAGARTVREAGSKGGVEATPESFEELLPDLCGILRNVANAEEERAGVADIGVVSRTVFQRYPAGSVSDTAASFFLKAPMIPSASSRLPPRFALPSQNTGIPAIPLCNRQVSVWRKL